jgi:hypothetical protein
MQAVADIWETLQDRTCMTPDLPVATLFVETRCFGDQAPNIATFSLMLSDQRRT